MAVETTNSSGLWNKINKRAKNFCNLSFKLSKLQNLLCMLDKEMLVYSINQKIVSITGDLGLNGEYDT